MLSSTPMHIASVARRHRPSVHGGSLGCLRSGSLTVVVQPQCGLGRGPSRPWRGLDMALVWPQRGLAPLARPRQPQRALRPGARVGHSGRRRTSLYPQTVPASRIQLVPCILHPDTAHYKVSGSAYSPMCCIRKVPKYPCVSRPILRFACTDLGTTAPTKRLAILPHTQKALGRSIRSFWGGR